MADRQYLPLAEPLTLPPALDPPQPHLCLPEPVRRQVRVLTAGASVLLEPGSAMPLLALGEIVRRPLRALGEASSFYGQADAVVTPDLIAMNLVSPLPRRRLMQDVTSGQLPILEAQPMPGDLATTVVAGSQPWVAIPSGMTPGDDSDG